MENNLLEDIKLFAASYPKVKMPKFSNWFLKEKYCLEEETKFLEHFSDYLFQKYKKTYDVSELKKMMKLFYVYPDSLPFEIRNLSWNVVKRLLDIFDEDKRNFYVDLCFNKNLTLDMLNDYLSKDIYEKFLYCLGKYEEDLTTFNLKKYEELIDQVILIEERIV